MRLWVTVVLLVTTSVFADEYLVSTSAQLRAALCTGSQDETEVVVIQLGPGIYDPADDGLGPFTYLNNMRNSLKFRCPSGSAPVVGSSSHPWLVVKDVEAIYFENMTEPPGIGYISNPPPYVEDYLMDAEGNMTPFDRLPYALYKVAVLITGDRPPSWPYLQYAEVDGFLIWRAQYWGSDIPDPLGDFDRDGVNEIDEFRVGTSPLLPDSDGDTLPDGWELEFCGLNAPNPLVADGQDTGVGGFEYITAYQSGLNPRFKYEGCKVMALPEGWNLIGVGDDCLAPQTSLMAGSLWGWTGRQYFPVEDQVDGAPWHSSGVLKAGHGYWLFLSGAGEIVLLPDCYQ